METKQVQVIELGDWNDLVEEVYGRPYNFQQQDSCYGRGVHEFTIPVDPDLMEDFEPREIPEEINGNVMGVSFEAWKARDPRAKPEEWQDWELRLFWERNFYPKFHVIAHDLHQRGEIQEGDYMINID